MHSTVLLAMQEVQTGLCDGALKTHVIEHDGTNGFEGLSLMVGYGVYDDFVYDVYLVKVKRPNFTSAASTNRQILIKKQSNILG